MALLQVNIMCICSQGSLTVKFLPFSILLCCHPQLRGSQDGLVGKGGSAW